MPVLDRQAQQAFWDRQAATYSERSMTRDNEGELSVVEKLCDDFVQRGYVAEDVVTLGGANGCRDPRVVMDALARHSQTPRAIYFNDLSEKMVEAACTGSLAEYNQRFIAIASGHGAIHENVAWVPTKPRRVIVGVYKAAALVSTEASKGYTQCGIEGYIRNGGILGNRFTFEAMTSGQDSFEPMGIKSALNAHAAPLRVQIARRVIDACLGDEAVSAIQVLGYSSEDLGQFLSHWYTERGISSLIRRTFAKERLGSISITSCAKGYVICIDSIEPPCGIVTILNNVIGNVLPHEQAETLRTIDRISR